MLVKIVEYLVFYLFFRDFHQDTFELVKAVVDSLASPLFHQRFVRLNPQTAIISINSEIKLHRLIECRIHGYTAITAQKLYKEPVLKIVEN